MQLDLWLGSTKLDQLQLESVSRSHWVFRSYLCAAQIPVGTVLKVRCVCSHGMEVAIRQLYLLMGTILFVVVTVSYQSTASQGNSTRSVE